MFDAGREMAPESGHQPSVDPVPGPEGPEGPFSETQQGEEVEIEL